MTLPTIEDIDAEIQRRQAVKARDSLLEFVVQTKPDFEVNWHHVVLCHFLEQLARRDIQRLMVSMPPRHGKSELVSRRFPAWLLGLNPNETIISSSYSADLSSRFNRDVQRIIDDAVYAGIFPDTKLFGKNVRSDVQGSWLRNNDIFEIVGRAGVYRSAGVGVGITGMGFTTGIIDDPVKDDAQASSKTYRDALWEWYATTFLTRQAPNAAICLTMTRWHEDDLAGRLLDLQAHDADADQWTVLRLPALCETEGELADELYEQLGIHPRDIGDALWPERYSVEKLAALRANSRRKFEALYQQSPKQLEGDLFKVAHIKIVDAVPAGARRVRYWDKAGTEGGSGAETAGVKIAESNGLYYIEDVIHGRFSTLERERTIRQTAEMDGTDVEIWIEQEPGSGGKESAESTIRNLAGFTIYAEKVGSSKEVRAEPLSAQVEAGNVMCLQALWTSEYIEQLRAFPHGKLKDMVDASTGGFNKLATRKEPTFIPWK